MTKRIDTTISDCLWKAAVTGGIQWHDALEIGIQIMVGSLAEEKLKKDIAESEKRLVWMKEEHARIVAEKERAAAERTEWIKTAALMMKKNPRMLEIKTNQYNIKFREKITMKELDEKVKVLVNV